MEVLCWVCWVSGLWFVCLVSMCGGEGRENVRNPMRNVIPCTKYTGEVGWRVVVVVVLMEDEGEGVSVVGMRGIRPGCSGRGGGGAPTPSEDALVSHARVCDWLKPITLSAIAAARGGQPKTPDSGHGRHG